MRNLQLQPRDIAALMELAEIGMIDSATYHARHFASNTCTRASLRRLKQYATHDLVHCLAPAVTTTDGRPRRLPMLYRLSRRGAEVLETITGQPIPRPAARDARPETWLHRLGIAKMQLAVNDACTLHRLPPPRWINEMQTFPDLADRMRKAKDQKQPLPANQRFILYERFPLPNGRTATCWPDASSLLSMPTAGGVHPIVIYWEYDRSTERIAQVTSKMYGYSPMLSTHAYRSHWPGVAAPTVRIFFVVQSNDRLQNIARALATLKNCPASGAVRLTTVAELQPAELLTKAIWQTVDGMALSIIQQPMPAQP